MLQFSLDVLLRVSSSAHPEDPSSGITGATDDLGTTVNTIVQGVPFIVPRAP